MTTTNLASEDQEFKDKRCSFEATADTAWTLVVHAGSDQTVYPVDRAKLSQSSPVLATGFDSVSAKERRLDLSLIPEEANIFPIVLDYIISGSKLSFGMSLRQVTYIYGLAAVFQISSLRHKMLQRFGSLLATVSSEDFSFMLHRVQDSNDCHFLCATLMSIPKKRNEILSNVPQKDLKRILSCTNLETWSRAEKWIKVEGAGSPDVNGTYNAEYSNGILRFIRDGNWRGIPCRYSLSRSRIPAAGTVDEWRWEIAIQSMGSREPDLLFYESHQSKSDSIESFTWRTTGIGVQPAPTVHVVRL